MIKESDLTEIGLFRKTHALKGELNATFDIDPELLNTGDCLIICVDGIYVPFFIQSIRTKGSSGALVKIDQIDTEDDARIFVNKPFYALTSSLPEECKGNEEDGGYAEDFIGFKVSDPDSGFQGKIIDVDLSTDNALFIVESGNRTIMIPVADEIVTYMDMSGKHLILSIPSGLLDLN